MDLSDCWINLNGLIDLVIQRVIGLGGGLNKKSFSPLFGEDYLVD